MERLQRWFSSAADDGDAAAAAAAAAAALRRALLASPSAIARERSDADLALALHLADEEGCDQEPAAAAGGAATLPPPRPVLAAAAPPPPRLAPEALRALPAHELHALLDARGVPFDGAAGGGDDGSARVEMATLLEVVMASEVEAEAVRLTPAAEASPTPSAPPAPPAFRRQGSSFSRRNPACGGGLECGLCCEIMGGGAARAAAAPRCGHVFCLPCLERLAAGEAGASVCPTCRAPLRAADVKRLFL
jgi:hypothetical protein